ncbi:DNA-binding protein, partial [Citrobacter cronae]|uniref:DNA-binding protein n=1 Tax=Citrobacter cronae TaxID=1748967 RepID=UPI001C555601
MTIRLEIGPVRVQNSRNYVIRTTLRSIGDSMARAGISKAQVQEAQQSLIDRGEHPTIDAIRIELGNTGSKTTIHRHLKALEEQPAGLADSASLSEPLTRLVTQLAAQLQAEGQARIDAAEARHSEQCAQLQVQLQLSQRALA